MILKKIRLGHREVPNERVIFVNLIFVRQKVVYMDKVPNGYNLEVFMIDLVKRIQHFFEEHAFGVCTRLGEKMGIATSSIRLFFIYASFLTFGSPIIVYMALAFIMNMRRHLRRRSTIWDY